MNIRNSMVDEEVLLTDEEMEEVSGGTLVQDWQERCLSYMARERKKYPDETIESFLSRSRMFWSFAMTDSAANRESAGELKRIEAFVRSNWNNDSALAAARPLGELID